MTPYAPILPSAILPRDAVVASFTHPFWWGSQVESQGPGTSMGGVGNESGEGRLPLTIQRQRELGKMRETFHLRLYHHNNTLFASSY